MSPAPDRAARQARRLLAFYPHAWRDRYGEEFTALLLDDIAERPRSLSRTADVVWSGLSARAANAGLAGDAPSATERVRRGLGVLAGAWVAFLVFGVAVWSQLTIGWQWSAPADPATRVAMLVMSGGMIAFAAVALLAAVPLLWALIRAFAGGRARGLLAPAACAAVGATVLGVGSIHFGHGWPGTGGHPWAGRDLVPAGVARAAWAATLWVTSYWAHPGELRAFPAGEVAWMVVSPLALFTLALGATLTVRRLPMSQRLLRYEAWLGAGAALAMAGFLAGAGSWVVSGGPAPRGLFRVGAIDAVALGVMAAALVLAFRATQRALSAGLLRLSRH